MNVFDHDDCDGTVEEAARETVLESRGAYVVTETCDECNHRVNSIGVADQVTTEEELHTLIGQLYRSFYEDPRSIGYMTLGALVDIEDLPVVDFLADVVDMAVRDARRGRDPRGVDEITEVLL